MIIFKGERKPFQTKYKQRSQKEKTLGDIKIEIFSAENTIGNIKIIRYNFHLLNGRNGVCVIKLKALGEGTEDGSICGAPSEMLRFPPSQRCSQQQHLQGEAPTLEVSHHELHMVENSKDSRNI